MNEKLDPVWQNQQIKLFFLMCPPVKDKNKNKIPRQPLLLSVQNTTWNRVDLKSNLFMDKIL